MSMSNEKYLIYLDQNIISRHVNGVLNITTQPDFHWVYSREHFAEIRRSCNPEPYLQVLEKIDAKLLEFSLDNKWRITGSARLNENGTPAEYYDKYLATCEDVPFEDTLFDSFLVRANGGDDKGELQKSPDTLVNQVSSVLETLPVDNFDITAFSSGLKSLLKDSISLFEQQDNDVINMRTVLGNDKGSFGAVIGNNQILQMWDMISQKYPDLTCEQFFGFDPVDKQGYDSWPIYLGIIGCCTVMDIIGFQAEKKSRKIEKIPNIRSDANHIAMGAFCTAILSGDKRLVKRANAIYEYKSIGTKSLFLTSWSDFN